MWWESHLSIATTLDKSVPLSRQSMVPNATTSWPMLFVFAAFSMIAAAPIWFNSTSGSQMQTKSDFTVHANRRSFDSFVPSGTTNTVALSTVMSVSDNTTMSMANDSASLTSRLRTSSSMCSEEAQVTKESLGANLCSGCSGRRIDAAIAATPVEVCSKALLIFRAMIRRARFGDRRCSLS